MKSVQHTNFIELNTGNCRACWKCMEKCSQKVIGKIDLFFHKHAKVKNPENCTGCLKCMKACEHGAISRQEL